MNILKKQMTQLLKEKENLLLNTPKENLKNSYSQANSQMIRVRINKKQI